MSLSTLFLCTSLTLAASPNAPGDPHLAPGTMRVFGTEIPVNGNVLQQLVLSRIPTGIPMQQAQALLEQEGFRCQPQTLHFFSDPDFSWRWHNYSKEDTDVLAKARFRDHLLLCHLTTRVLKEWNLESVSILVVLFPGPDQTVQRVAVGGRHWANHYTFFWLCARFADGGVPRRPG